MKRYKTYKDSGVQWIGSIPTNWKTVRIKNVFRVVTGATPDSNKAMFWDGDVVWITPSDFKTKDHFVAVGKRLITKDGYNSCATNLVPAGSIIFSKRAPIGSVAIAKNNLCTNQGCLSCIPTSKANSNFYYYSFSIFTEAFEMYGSGATFKEISTFDFSNFRVPYPSIDEQKMIATFLDEKTAEIDELVCEVEREIELLKEYKQAEIARVVTKGLNPNAPMKPSGISWIGEIPQHWNIRKLFQVATSYYESNKGMKNQNLLSLSYGAIIQKDINKTDGLLPASFETYQIVQPNIIVLRLTDLQNDHKSLRVGISKYEGIVTSAYEALKVREPNNADYVYYQLHTNDIHKVFYGMGNGLRQNLNYAGMKYMNLVVPPTEEQQEIVKYIDHKTTEIDRLVAELTYQVEYLKEYKQRLIADVVTGKINVQPE